MKRLLLIPLVLFLACEDKQEKIYGCTDKDANNFNPDATIFDNSCEYDIDCAGEYAGNNICGCTDTTAINYDDLVTFDDGSCEYEPVFREFLLDDLDDCGYNDSTEWVYKSGGCYFLIDSIWTGSSCSAGSGSLLFIYNYCEFFCYDSLLFDGGIDIPALDLSENDENAMIYDYMLCWQNLDYVGSPLIPIWRIINETFYGIVGFGNHIYEMEIVNDNLFRLTSYISETEKEVIEFERFNSD